MNSRNLSQYFKSIIDQDRCAVVICNLAHEIIYMNPAAVERYAKSTEHNIVHTFYNEKENKDGYMVALRDEKGTLTGYYEKHEYRDADTSAFYDF